MSEEIKEILEELKNDSYIRPYQDVYSEYPIKTIDKKQTKLLLRYITNLQKENEKLKETLQTDKLMKAFMVEHNRNEKAIEKLGKYKHYTTPTEEQNSENEDIVDSAYNILKGGDE